MINENDHFEKILPAPVGGLNGIVQQSPTSILMSHRNLTAGGKAAHSSLKTGK